MKKRSILVFLALLSTVFSAFSQDASTPQPAVIHLRNPSFENDVLSESSPMAVVKEWLDCGSKKYTPPDIQPGSFEVFLPPSDGNSYICLVTRTDGTYETLSQKLQQPLQQKTMYLWRMDLCSSNELVSPTPEGIVTLFNAPAKMYVWGGNDACEKAELLDSTNWVKNTNWKRYTMVLCPQKNDYTYITFEVGTGLGVKPKVRGNIMVDNTSALIPFNPNQSDSLLTADFLKQWFNPRLLSKRWKGSPASGSLYLADGLGFSKNDESIQSSRTASLKVLLEQLTRFPQLKIEIGAYTVGNVNNATEVSTRRAQLVADWLIEKGIEPQRITHKGYGQSMLHLYEENARDADERNRVVVRVW